MARCPDSRTTGALPRAITRPWAMVVVLLWTTAALARGGPLDILSLPRDVDAALCIRDGASASRGPSGRAARQMADELSARLGLPSAWDELWKTLDLPASEAIDRLLGERVLIAWRWPERDDPGAQDLDRRAAPPDAPDWVLISLVSTQTERRIRERLRPAPRDVEAGQAIMAFEDGRFVLTTRTLEGARRESDDGGALIMLAPASHMGLFKQMLPRLAHRDQGPSLRDEARLSPLARLFEADVAFLARDRRGDGPPTVLALGASWRRDDALDRLGPGLDARLARLSDPAIPMVPDSGLAPGQIDALGANALLAVFEILSRQPAPPAERSVAVDFPGGLNVAGVIGAITARLDIGADLAARLLGPGAIVVVEGTGRLDEPLSLTLGVAVSDLAAIAPSADRLMSTLLASPVGLSGESSLGPDFRGCYPPAVRVATIPAGSPANLGGLLGDEHCLAWQFCPMEGSLAWRDPPAPGAPKAATRRQPDRAAPSPWAVGGWWISRIGRVSPGSDSGARLEAIASVLTSRQETRGVVTAGLLRPAEALGAIAAIGVPVPPAMGVLRWIDRVRWEGTPTEPGCLMIDLSIDLKPGMGASP